MDDRLVEMKPVEGQPPAEVAAVAPSLTKKKKKKKKKKTAVQRRLAAARGQGNHLVGGLATLTTHRDPHHGLEVTLQCRLVPELMPGDLEWAFDLTATSMRDLYRGSSWGWNPAEKRAEMADPRMHYVIARDGSGRRVGFVSGLFDVEEGAFGATSPPPVFYLFELMVAPDYHRKGLGATLLATFEAIAREVGVVGSVLTCFVCKFDTREKYVCTG